MHFRAPGNSPLVNRGTVTSIQRIASKAGDRTSAAAIADPFVAAVVSGLCASPFLRKSTAPPKESS